MWATALRAPADLWDTLDMCRTPDAAVPLRGLGEKRGRGSAVWNAVAPEPLDPRIPFLPSSAGATVPPPPAAPVLSLDSMTVCFRRVCFKRIFFFLYVLYLA